MRRIVILILPAVLACAAPAIHRAWRDAAPGTYTGNARSLVTLAWMGVSVPSVVTTPSPAPGAAPTPAPASSSSSPIAAAKSSPTNPPASGASPSPAQGAAMSDQQGGAGGGVSVSNVVITIGDFVPSSGAKPAPAGLATPAANPAAAANAAPANPAALPREKKRNIAIRILEDLRLIDSATDQYAIETNKSSGMNPSFGDLKNYLRSGTALYDTGKDSFGNAYGPFTVDSIPQVSGASFNALSDVADESFWSPYH